MRVKFKRLTEQPHMEHVVDPGTGWQLESICQLPNTLQDDEGASISRSELALRPRVQGLSRAMQEAQPHPVTHRVLDIAMVAVIVVLGHLLGLNKTLSYLGKHLISATKERTGSLRPS